MTPELEQKIREKAYEIWVLEGRPDDRETAHWEMAENLVNQDEPHDEEGLEEDAIAEAPLDAPPATKKAGS